MRVAVITNDKYLRQKIRLLLRGGISDIGEADLLLTDEEAPVDFSGRVIRMSRSGECELGIPFSFEELEHVLSEKREAEPILSLGNRSVTLRGKKIPLTELEFALFKTLYSAGGEYVSRESLLSSVWGSTASDGILNVYIHYLREKLEADGEKIIISSRKYGYKISERYVCNA